MNKKRIDRLTHLQTFTCDELEDVGERWLRADYGIDCDSSKHKAFQLYAGFMILVGIFIFCLVFVRVGVFVCFATHARRSHEGFFGARGPDATAVARAVCGMQQYGHACD